MARKFFKKNAHGQEALVRNHKANGCFAKAREYDIPPSFVFSSWTLHTWISVFSAQ